MYFYMVKPVSHSIYLKVMESFNQKEALWKIYKFFTLLLSLIKVDFVMNCFFGASMIYFTYSHASVTLFMLLDIMFFGSFIAANAYAIFCII